jgi:hypothetical protein
MALDEGESPGKNRKRGSHERTPVDPSIILNSYYPAFITIETAQVVVRYNCCVIHPLYTFWLPVIRK